MCHYQGVAPFFLHGLQLIASCHFLYEGTEEEIILCFLQVEGHRPAEKSYKQAAAVGFDVNVRRI